ncbi:hypothetical protein T02_15908 [Trichinella nativa]|uniref:Uncharacterized protein n=1 Tax=Trichinella nativa TaxID=6335 RepID=A0A0V1LJX6_9BILA|nr:hypothetical protein T02_15908 [Trichinella nativa]
MYLCRRRIGRRIKIPSKEYGSALVGSSVWYLVLESCRDESMTVFDRRSRAGGSQAEDMTAQRNPPVDTRSSPSHDSANGPVGVRNESARKSGSLHYH